MTRILILGGSYFIGKKTVDIIKKRISNVDMIIANRGTKSPPTIIIDRNDPQSCQKLQGMYFDLVIDFSAYIKDHLVHIISNIECDYYCFLSTGRAENPVDEDQYGRNKRDCENLIVQQLDKYLIIRPGYVVGEEDYTERFIRHPTGDVYCHKDRPELVRQCISVDLLASTLVNLIIIQKTGIISLGYFSSHRG